MSHTHDNVKGVQTNEISTSPAIAKHRDIEHTHPIFDLQNQMGNQWMLNRMQGCPLVPQRCPTGGVCHLCPESTTSSSHGYIQPKLKIGQPNDKYEQEADRVAEQIMKMPEPKLQKQSIEEEEEEELQAKPISDQITPLVQRQPEEEEEEEELQMKPISEHITPFIQRQEPEEEYEEEEIIEDGEELQTKPAGGQVPYVSPSLQAQIRSLRGGGQPLSRDTRNFFEPRFGYDFNKVRIHANSSAEEAAGVLNAKAFTFGENIVFGAKKYEQETIEGKRLLAHELTHVIQQNCTEQNIPSVQLQTKTYWFQDKPPKSPKAGKIVTLEEKMRNIIKESPTEIVMKGIGTVFVRFAYSEIEDKEEMEKAKMKIRNTIGKIMADLLKLPVAEDIHQRREDVVIRERFKQVLKFTTENKPLNIFLISFPTPTDFKSGKFFPTTDEIYINVDDIDKKALLEPAIKMPIVRILGGYKVVGGVQSVPKPDIIEIKNLLLHEQTHAMLIKRGCNWESIWNKIKSNLNISGPSKLKSKIEELAKLFLLAQEEIFIYNEVDKMYPSSDAKKTKLLYEIYSIAARLLFEKELGAEWHSETCKLMKTKKTNVPGGKKSMSVGWEIVYQFPKSTAIITKAIQNEVDKVYNVWPIR